MSALSPRDHYLWCEHILLLVLPLSGRISLITADECDGQADGAVSASEAEQFLSSAVPEPDKPAADTQPEATDDLVCVALLLVWYVWIIVT